VSPTICAYALYQDHGPYYACWACARMGACAYNGAMNLPESVLWLSDTEESAREADSDAMAAAVQRGPETGIHPLALSAADVADLDDQWHDEIPLPWQP
jgi:hypothetical protein